MQIPFLSFEHMNSQVRTEIMQAFESFFDKSWYILGTNVEQFEEQYSNFNGTGHTVGVSNGLDALQIALKVLGLGPGDEVIVPSNTYIATLLAVSLVGAKPVLVEPNATTYNIDAENIIEAITPFTKAIIPVHLYGQACNMDAIMEIAGKYHLFVVEDNAQAHGASWNNKMTGSWGHLNATSFYPGKNLGAYGDAGALTTNCTELARQCRVLRNYGSEKKYYNEVLGYNMRLDECQAGFLSVKLKYLQEWTKQRQQVAAWYSTELEHLTYLQLPFIAPLATNVFHLYVILTNRRDALHDYLKAAGIGSLIHYPIPPHMQQAYKELGFKKGDFPVAEKIANECLSLPLWPGMSHDEVMVVCNHIKSFFHEF